MQKAGIFAASLELIKEGNIHFQKKYLINDDKNS